MTKAIFSPAYLPVDKKICNPSVPCRVMDSMKILSLPLLAAGAVGLAATGGLIYATTTHSTPPTPTVADSPAPMTAPSPAPAASDSSTLVAANTVTPPPVSTNSATATPSPAPPQGQGKHGQGGGQKGKKIQHILDQLNLSDTQKQQIAQIRQSNLGHKQEKQAIMAVLTPQQQAAFEQLRGPHGKPGGKHYQAPASSPTGTMTSSGSATS